MFKKLTHLTVILSIILSSGVYANEDLVGLESFGSDNQEQAITQIEKLSVFNRAEEIFKNPSRWWEKLEKEDKAMVTNVALISFIAVWGLAQWDYGSAGRIYFKNEGWFGKDTKYGGADKLGHLWSTYAYADALGALYRKWGYDAHEAAKLSALSSWVIQGLMEVFDGSSAAHGFAYEDMVMNTLGALASYMMQKHPELNGLIDLRIMYQTNVAPVGLFDDYTNMTYLAVLKLEGIKGIRNEFLKLLEIHVGYYTRGYDTPKEMGLEKTRDIYVGLGLNFAKLFRNSGHNKTATFLEYMQIPGTSMSVVGKQLN